MFWRPPHEWRAARGYWFLSPRLQMIETTQAAARSIYRCFNICPDLLTADNDTDAKRW